MAPLPQYEGRTATLPNLTTTIQPLAAPDLSGAAAGAKAMAGLGKEMVDVAVKIHDAQAKSDAAAALTDYVTGLDTLEQKYKNADYRTGPGEFERERDELLRATSGRIRDDGLRQTTTLEMTRAGIVSGRRIRETALSNERDANGAMLDTQEHLGLREAATAATPLERQATIARIHGQIDQAAASGWITDTQAVARKQRFQRYIDSADVTAAIRRNPWEAQQLLDDPQQFPALDPYTRESFKNQAQSETERVMQAESQNLARRDPGRAVGVVGRAAGPRSIDVVFERGILPNENATGDNTLVSTKGATGASQIMPGTAREVLQGLSPVALINAGLTPERRAELVKMDDGALTRVLTAPESKGLNLDLGRTYWRQMNDRYSGRIWVAAAAYNAGPGKADEWVAQATQQFGPTFTDQQFLSIVSFKETRDYVRKLGERLGADPEAGHGMSHRGLLTAAVTVESALGQEEREETRQLKAVAKVMRDTDDPATVFKAGFDVDPVRYQSWLLVQQQAAAGGDETAAKAVREAEFQRTLLPHKRAALSMSPAELEAAIAGGEATLRAGGNASPDQVRQLAVFKEVAGEIGKARNDNIVGLAEQAGFVAPDRRVQIDPAADPASEDFRARLSQRGVIAEQAAQRWQGNAIALKPQELAAMKDRWGQAGSEERFRLIEAFATSLQGRAYEDTLSAVIGSDSTSRFAGMIALDRPQLAREILLGAELAKTKEVGDKAAVVRPALAAKLGGRVYPSPAMQDDVVNAALALYTARRGQAGQLYDATDTSGIEQAIEDVAGKIVTLNGRKTPIAPGTSIAPGLSEGAFKDTFRNLTDAGLDFAGGAFGRDGRPIAAAEIGRYAQLLPLSPGSSRYAVAMPAPNGDVAPVLNQTGGPLVLDMRFMAAYAPGLTPPEPTPAQRGASGFRTGQAERIMRDRQGGAP